MDKGPQYNITIFTELNGQSFKDDLKTGRKDSYDLICSVDAYEKEHVIIPDDASSGGGRLIPSALS